MNDLKFAFRQLLKNPGFTAVAVLTLALGIGANTAIFSLVNAVMLRPPPFPEPGRLAFLSEKSRHMDDMSISYPNLLDWREQNQVFEGLAGFRVQGFNLTGQDRPERVEGYGVSASFFSVLRVRPLHGRVFRADEDQPGADRVVVLSEGLWQRRFGGDLAVLDQPIKLNGESYTVIGVMPRAFQFPRTVELWTPLGLNYGRESWKLRGNHPGIYAVARLKPGVTIEQARTGMETIAARLAQQYPESNTGTSVTMISLRERMVREARPALLLLLGAVGLVLLIACANLANLLMARSAARQKELAIRAALGAARARIVRQLLCESLVLALVGGLFGLLLALWGIDLLRQIIPAELTEAIVISIDGTVLLFTVGIAVASGIAFGLVPAWHASRPNLTESLKEGAPGAGEGRSRQRFRQALVVSEIGLALVLLIGACLLIRSFGQVQAISPGINSENVSTMYFALPQHKYGEDYQQLAFFDELLRRTTALPGVTAASVTTTLFGGWQNGYHVEGQAPLPPGQGHLCDYAMISPDHFKVMGIPLLRGRQFADADSTKAAKVTIIDEKFAKKFWPNSDPLGHRLQMGGNTNDLLMIVGVAGHVKNYGVDASSREELYVPVAQASSGAMNLVIKTARPMAELAANLRAVVQEIDPDQPLTRLRTLESILGENLAPRRVTMLLLSVFSALAIILAAVGIYGVMAYSVSQRTREIGVRMALGAAPPGILRMILGQGMVLILIGVGAGFVIALGATRFLGRLLYGIQPTDPLTYLSMALLLIGVGLTACFLPARRATRVEPMLALRQE